MGAIVLEIGERKQFRVIDGQQRMATLRILILACVECLYALADDGVDPAAIRERASLLESSFLGAKDPTSLRLHEWKEETIARRQEAVAKVAKAVWALPT